MKRKKITIQEAKKINIEYPLKLSGITPAKKYNGYDMYFAFDRKESTPSLKIDYSKNLYYDFGSSKGGDIISLVQLMNKCSVSEALEFLSKNVSSFSFQQQPKNLTRSSEVKNYQIRKIKKLENPALLNYLKSRGIKIEVAKKYCQEIYYQLNSKKYFSIAFENDKNGFEVRNKYFKGNLINKNITTIKNNSKSVCIFEGFMDFLSYKVLFKNENSKTDFIILNSVSNVKNILQKIKKYDTIFCYLDNDIPGKEATSFLSSNHKNSLDYSFIYKNFNDLNDYLINRKI